jgi:uncharacterized protein (TIGR03437 family)
MRNMLAMPWLSAASVTFVTILFLCNCALAIGQTLTVVSSATYEGVPADATGFPYVASGSIVSMFAPNIATGTLSATDPPPAPLPTSLGGVSATITDASGKVQKIGLAVVTPGQVNAVLPNVATGLATVDLTTSTGAHVTGQVNIEAVDAGLFSADQTGTWLAAAQVVTTHADGSQTIMGSIAACTGNLAYNGYTWSHCVPIPINLGSSTDTVVLVLYGTGLRGINAIPPPKQEAPGTPNIWVTWGNDGCGPASAVPIAGDCGSLPVLYIGAQGAGAPGSFYGLDQVNVVLPKSLAGSGVNYVYVGYNDISESLNSNSVFIYIQ